VFVPASAPWPFLTAQILFCLVLDVVAWFHYYKFAVLLMFVSAAMLGLIVSYWFKDIIFEAQYMGVYTLQNNLNLRLGFALFLVSEVMFFFSFFWAYFHYSLVPSV